MNSLEISHAFVATLEKRAADAATKPKPKSNDPSMMLPPSPLDMENEELGKRLQNVQIKLQLRQALQVMQAQAQMDQQQAQQSQQGGPPPPGQAQIVPSANPMADNPSLTAPPPGLPTSPQQMAGEG